MEWFNGMRKYTFTRSRMSARDSGWLAAEMNRRGTEPERLPGKEILPEEKRHRGN
ncbi:MAG: hypothetical protein AB8B50_03005 [Pirellulaceae bacterium]